MFGLIRNRGKRRAATVGVALGSDGAAVARVRAGGRDAPPRLDAIDYLPATDARKLAQRLANHVDEHGLESLTATAVLAPGEYQVLQVEAPNVPAAEVRQAAGWRVRELIDFPLDQAVIDTFDPPEAAQRSQNPMVNVVVARRGVVADRIRMIEDAGFDLEVIDIPEMAQRNISRHLPEARGGHALLALRRRGGLLTVYRDGELFMARDLDTGLSDLEDADEARRENLMLEIQRSFDYYESALSQAPVGALHIYPAVEAVSAFLERAFTNVVNNIDGRGLALADVLALDEEPEAADAAVLHAVGGALRGQEVGT